MLSSCILKYLWVKCVSAVYRKKAIDEHVQ